MSLNAIELALINHGMSRKEIVDKIEALTSLPDRYRKTPEEAARMLLDQHPGFELLLENRDEEDIFK